MKKNVLLVVNPVSGGVDKEEFIEAVNDFASHKAIQVIVYLTTGVEDKIRIKALFTEFQPERVIVAGGDGTIKMAGEALAYENVIFGILPLGSSNGLAVELDLLKTLEENIQIAFCNDYVEIDMVVINGRKSLHLSDIGLNAVLIKNYKNSKIHGKWGYALQILNTLLRSKGKFIATISTERKTMECEANMIVIANAQKYGTGVVINPLGVINDGKFELVVLKNLSLSVFIKIVLGNMPINFKDVEIISTKSAKILVNKPISFQIDGEYVGELTDLEMAISKEKMRVAVG
ncbi:diacylglycerol/lipid kinase family protein [Flavobacterium faecale]|uniref:diacylglycerol/lipid kinase family protein n=1 Tax=Flavobacterium faecale TaxID=1355330 RepID=UPI003AAC84B9